MTSNQWAFITSSNTRNDWLNYGKNNGVRWKSIRHARLRSIARWSGWWLPWAISKPSWCFVKWVNEFNQTSQCPHDRAAWCPIAMGWKPYKTRPGKARGVDYVAIDLPIKTHTSHHVVVRGFDWTNCWKIKCAISTKSCSNGIGAQPLWQHDDQCRPTSHSVTFKELICSYKTGETSFDDLILEVRCESCFTSVFEEAQQQLGADSPTLDMLADEFPIYHQSLIRQQ